MREKTAKGKIKSSPGDFFDTLATARNSVDEVDFSRDRFSKE